MRLIRPHHWAPQRWANGAGITHELWRDPLDGALTVRLSVATLAPGPFSPLPDLDRVFVPLGDGVTLDGVAAPAGVPVRFPGERPPHCALSAGPADAFNVLVRRGVEVQLGHAAGDTSFVFALGDVRLGHGRVLAPRDLVVARGPLAGEGAALRGSLTYAAPGPLPPPRGLVDAFERAVVTLASPVAETVWVVTAFNPRGELLSDATNAERQAALERRVAGLSWVRAEGRDAAGTWREPSLALRGCGREAALALAREFDQDAIYELAPDGARTTLWC